MKKEVSHSHPFVNVNFLLFDSDLNVQKENSSVMVSTSYPQITIFGKQHIDGT